MYGLSGDLSQMYHQREVLYSIGVSTTMKGGVPFVETEEDYKKALEHFWYMRTEGWWNYINAFDKYGIVSEAEAREALHRQCEAKYGRD